MISDLADHLRVRPALDPKVANGSNRATAVLERGDVPRVLQLFIQDEKRRAGHDDSERGRGFDPLEGLFYVARVKPVLINQDSRPFVVVSDLRNALDWPPAATQRGLSAHLFGIDLDPS